MPKAKLVFIHPKDKWIKVSINPSDLYPCLPTEMNTAYFRIISNPKS